MKLRFSISNLLLLTALIAMGLGWYLDHNQISKKYQAKSDAFSRLVTQTANAEPIQSFHVGLVDRLHCQTQSCSRNSQLRDRLKQVALYVGLRNGKTSNRSSAMKPRFALRSLFGVTAIVGVNLHLPCVVRHELLAEWKEQYEEYRTRLSDRCYSSGLRRFIPLVSTGKNAL